MLFKRLIAYWESIWTLTNWSVFWGFFHTTPGALLRFSCSKFYYLLPGAAYYCNGFLKNHKQRHNGLRVHWTLYHLKRYTIWMLLLLFFFLKKKKKKKIYIYIYIYIQYIRIYYIYRSISKNLNIVKKLIFCYLFQKVKLSYILDSLHVK